MKLLLNILSILIISFTTSTAYSQKATGDYVSTLHTIDDSSLSELEKRKRMSFETTKLVNYAKFIESNKGINGDAKTQKNIAKRIKLIQSFGPQLVRTFSLLPNPKYMRKLITVQELSGVSIFKSADMEKLTFTEYTSSELNELHARQAQGEVLALGQSAKLKVKLYFKRFANEFKTAFPAFTAAQFAVAAQHLGDNPVGVEQIAEQLEDPFLMTSSFAVFIGGSHLAQAVMPKSMKPKPGQAPGFTGSSIGLGVGMLLSAVYTEVYNDIKFGVIAECIADFQAPSNITTDERQELEDNFNKQQAQSCAMAEQKWKTHDKYVNYVPDVTSLIAAFGMTHKTFEVLGKLMSKTKLLNKYVPYMKNVNPSTLFSPDILTKLRGLGVSPVGAMGMAFVNFMVFMNYHHKIMPYFTRPWNHLNFTGLGWSLSQELKGDKPKDNSDFLRTYRAVKRKTKWIDDNLTNIKSVMTYEYLDRCVDSTYTNFNSKEFWARMGFALTDSANVVWGIGKSLVKGKWDLPRKSYEQSYIMEACNQYANPSLIIENDYAFNKERQRLRLQTFSQKQANWMQLIGNYTQRANDTKAIYSKMLQLKKEFTPTENQAYPEELSFEYFKESFGNEVGSYPKGHKLYNVKFNHMAEFYIFQMMCGPELNGNLGEGTAPASLESNQAEIPYIETPFGSSVKFIPPKVTKTSKEICKSKDFKSLGQVSSYERQTAKLPGDASDIFKGIWEDKEIARLVKNDESEARSKYNNLAEYVFDNLDIEAIEKIVAYDEEREGYTWTQFTLDTLNDVWSNFEDSYKHLIKKSLIPLLINSDPSGARSSITYNWGTMKKSFMNALDLKPFIPETKARFMKKLDTLAKSVEVLDRSTPEFVTVIEDIRSLLNKELEAHRKYVYTWDNYENYSGQDDYMHGQHISQELFFKMISINKSMKELDHDALSYSQEAISYIIISKSNNVPCDAKSLAGFQEESRSKLDCSQIKLALELHNSLTELRTQTEFINTQIIKLNEEISDYNQMIVQLLNVIGNFKK